MKSEIIDEKYIFNLKNKIYSEDTFNKFLEDETTNEELKNICDFLKLEKKEDKNRFKHIITNTKKVKGHLIFSSLFQK